MRHLSLYALAGLLTLSGCQSRETAPGSKAAPAAAGSAAEAVGRYGETLTPSEAVPLQKVLASPAEFADRTVTVDGAVRRNCTNRGCWMELAEGMDKSLPGCRVTFKNYGFFVPLDSAGSKARVQGTVNVKTVSAGEVRHMEGEGATFANKQADGSAMEVRLVATGVELRRGT